MAASNSNKNNNNSNKTQKFTIEDAFEDDPDEIVTMYGATTDRSPLRPKEHRDIRGEGGSYLAVPESNPDGDGSSRDSDSLIPVEEQAQGERGAGGSNFSASECWFRHPKVREKWKVVTGAFVLLVLGTVLLLTGVLSLILPIDNMSSPVFIIAGLICFIPGAYHVIYVIFAVYGRRGYDFYNIPVFN